MVPGWGRRKASSLFSAKPTWHQLTASTGHGLLSLPPEPPVFSFSGTGGIYFLCHFGGCLPCQRLFCRVQTDKKVVSRLFGGGREDCLVRERRLLCSQQPHAALPLRPPLQRTLALGTRQGQHHTSPLQGFLGASACGATLVTRDRVAVPGLGSVSAGIREMRLMNVQSNISIANLRALLRQCPETEPFLQDMCRGKKGQEPSPGCPMLWGHCCGYLAPSLFRNVSLEQRQEGAGPAGGSQGGNPEDSPAAQSISQGLPMETMRNCPRISPTE